MDTAPEITPELAVKALALLSAIFTTIFALWADFFLSYVEHLVEEDKQTPSSTPYDPQSDIVKARTGGMITLIFQLTLFLGTDDVRQSYPMTAPLIFIAALVVQGYIQASLESKLRALAPSKPGVTPAEAAKDAKESMNFVFRGFLWTALAGGIHLLVFCAVMVAGVQVIGLLSLAVGLPREASAFGMLCVTIGALLTSMGVAFALAPAQIRQTFKCTHFENERLAAELALLFMKQGLSVPTIWILETGAGRMANAMISGLTRGRGIFTPSIFVSRSMIEALDQDELRSILLHETSHAMLKHLRSRFKLAGGVIGAVTVAGLLAVMLLSYLGHGAGVANAAGPLVGFASVVIFFRALAHQSQKHEFEADHYAVVSLGASAEALASALNKIETINFKGRGAQTAARLTHPSTDARIAALRSLASTQKSEEPVAPSQAA